MSQSDDKLLDMVEEAEGATPANDADTPQSGAASPSVRIARMIGVSSCKDEGCGCEKVFLNFGDKGTA